MVSISYASIIADDIETLAKFYATTFALPELVEHATVSYRALDAGGGLVLAFSSPAAYHLLMMDGYRDARGTKQFLTFEADGDDEVDGYTAAAVTNGAQVLHPPYVTSYGSYQAVLADPEGNAFRLNRRRPATSHKETR